MTGVMQVAHIMAQESSQGQKCRYMTQGMQGWDSIVLSATSADIGSAHRFPSGIFIVVRFLSVGAGGS
jgi:hypothetical protein